jgi:signal peptidase I
MTAAAVVLAAVTMLLVLAWWLRRAFVVVTVTGRSMEPALRHGDRVLVRRAPAGAVRPGRVVVLATRPDGPWMVKRAVAVDAGGLAVTGDNAAFSHDSRHFGPLPADLLVGVVVHRLRPLQTPAANPPPARAAVTAAARRRQEGTRR